MKGILSKQGSRVAVATIALALVSGSAWAQEDAPDLGDLNDKELRFGEEQMAKRGFEMVQPAGEDGGPQYWWNEKRQRCVFLKLNGRKVGSLKTVGAHECGYYVEKKRRRAAEATSVSTD